MAFFLNFCRTWVLTGPLVTIGLIIHDVLMINYEQRSVLNHSKANLALAAIGLSGLGSAAMTHTLAQPSKAEQTARYLDANSAPEEIFWFLK